jgi:ferrochelatase
MSKKTGVLLLNLGTPDSPLVKDVRKYLKEFLNDPRVIDLPWLKRKLLVNLIIVPLRAPKSAKEYEKLWKQGNGASPLLTNGLGLQKEVQKMMPDDYGVHFAMRYQNPSMTKVLGEMRMENCDRIIVVPLYPHYASASTGSTIEEVFRIVKKWWAIPELIVAGQFYQEEGFLNCVANNARKFDIDSYDHVLFSYHGLPIRQLDKVYLKGRECAEHNCEDGVQGDNTLCYKATCYETTKRLVKMLHLKEGSYTTAFQSRLGRDPWVQPFSDVVVEDLAKAGSKRLLVLSPAFVSDCLETTIEIGEEYKNIFLEHGGVQLDLVPSLNTNHDWANFLVDKIKSM